METFYYLFSLETLKIIFASVWEASGVAILLRSIFIFAGVSLSWAAFGMMKDDRVSDKVWNDSFGWGFILTFAFFLLEVLAWGAYEGALLFTSKQELVAESMFLSLLAQITNDLLNIKVFVFGLSKALCSMLFFSTLVSTFILLFREQCLWLLKLEINGKKITGHNCTYFKRRLYSLVIVLSLFFGVLFIMCKICYDDFKLKSIQNTEISAN